MAERLAIYRRPALLVAVVLLALSGSIMYGDHLTLRGISQLQRGEIAAAVDSFRVATVFNPTSAAARMNLATVIVATSRDAGTIEQAKNLWHEALALEPYRYTWWQLFGSYLVQNGKHEEGAQVFRKAAEKAPYRQDVWESLIDVQVTLGVAAQKAGDKVAAAKWAEQARTSIKAMLVQVAGEPPHEGTRLTLQTERLERLQSALKNLP